uniref:Uncharacterized protein n=3 Tax=Quercus lobata TaxID=97700 RepID=A0A7N2LG68_QUELO
MGGLLRGCVDDVKKWQKIQSSEMWEIENQNSRNGKPKILAILKLSYDHLPSHLKRCFSYCSLFPKAYVFHKEELDSIGQALACAKIFQVSVIDDKEIFNMHDLIHELALSISSPNCCLINDNRSYSFSEQSHHVSLLGKDVEQPMLTIVENARKLRSLLFPSHYLKNFGQALDRAFHTMRYFRTLDLSSSMILELPSSIDELKLLRYLDLSRTEIKFLPNSICNLYNLETLKLLGCPWLFKLPKDLGNLVNLRHMELEDLFWFKFSVLPPKVGNLTRLQNWHAFRVGNKIGYRIEELKNMAYLSGTLHISQLENVVNVVEAKMNEKKYLRKLVFEWSDRVVNTHDDATEKIVLEGLQPHSNLKELQICQYRGNEFPAWMREGQLQNLVCRSWRNGQRSDALSLSRLKFSNCPKLRELPNCFPKLRTLKIKSCKSLRALPVAPSLMFLTLIDNLILEDWSEVVTAWEPMCGSWFNLLELNVTSCPKLQTLPIDFAPQKLEISGCELLVALPQPHFAERLQHLALDACLDGTLVRAIANTSSLYSLVISGVSNLTSLPQWPQLPGLKALYIRDCKDLMSLSESKEASLSTLLSLTLLSIRNCPMLVKLTEELPATLECLSIGSCPFLQSLGPKEILKSLPSLKDLYIEDCPMLQSLPEDGLPSSLQHLQIQRCPLLTERCQMEEGGGGGPDRPKVMHIPDLEIDFPTASSTSAYDRINDAHQAKNKPNSSCLKQNQKVSLKEAHRSCREETRKTINLSSYIPTTELEKSSVAVTTPTYETTGLNAPPMVGHEEASTVSNDSEDDDMESFYTWEPILKLVKLLCDLDESWQLDWNEIPSASILKGLHSSESHFCQANDTIERCTNLIKPMAEIVSQLEKNKENFLKLDSVEATIQSINESQINELQQKVHKQKTSTVGKSISGAKGQINDLKQKGKAREEKKIIDTDGKKLKEKWDVATNAEKEKKAAEKI